MPLRILLAGLLVAFWSSAANAETRVALIIGNSSYANVSKLANPVRDAAAVAAMLKAAEFDVVEMRTNLGALDLRRALRDFSDKVRNADIAVVFYAGHGIEVNGINYLIPVDAVLERDIDVEDESVSLDRITQILEQAKRLRLVILDACRDNPFVRSMRRTTASRSVGRGLAKVDVLTTDTLIAFAAKAGSTAADGDGTVNSPYTSALVKHLVTPGLDLRLALGRVRDEVLKSTGHRQEPFVYGSLGGAEIPLVAPKSPPAKTAPEQIEPRGSNEAAQAWNVAKDTADRAVLEAFIKHYGDTFYGAMARSRLAEIDRRQTMTAQIPSMPPAPSAIPAPSTKQAPPPPPQGQKTAMLQAARPIAASGGTLQQVKTRGQVRCGVGIGVMGFSNPNTKGEWEGLDADYCRAIAGAVLGDTSKVTFVPLTAKERFTALQSGEIDLLSRNSTWTMTRDTKLGLISAGVLYYDGQGFMTRKSLGVRSAKELNGAAICVQSGTTTELNLTDYFRANKLTFKPLVFEKYDEVVAAYSSGRCDVLTTDVSALHAERVKLDRPDDHIVLPEMISKEPLGPFVRQADAQWLKIARWTLFALIAAEEYGVTRANAGQSSADGRMEVRRLLGHEEDLGAELGLDRSWASTVIKSTGNYGEIFERNLGAGSMLRGRRGLNALWNNGGLMYAPPFW